MKRSSASRSRSKTPERRTPAPPPASADPGGLLATVLRERWRTYSMLVRRCRRRPTVTAIHDLRVATRRLIAVLDIVRAVVPDQQLARARRSFKKQLKGFNALRDAHVQLIRARRMARRMPALRAYIRRLQAQERQLVRGAGRHLVRAHMGQMEQWLAGMTTGGVPLFSRAAMAPAGEAALCGVAAAAFSRAVVLREQVAPADATSIHRFRVAFKKARYTMEALRPLLPWVTDRQLKAMNRYQTAMGEVQDIEVMTASVRDYAFRRPATAAGTFLPVYQELARERAERVEEFMRSADQIYSFWMPLPPRIPPRPLFR